MSVLVNVKILKSCLQTILLSVFFLQGSVTAKDDSNRWQAPFFQDHPLVGKIWDTHKNAWVTSKQFENELVHYNYILLGEVHTNPDHHRLQAEVINSLVRSGAKPSVVMEMLSHKSWRDQPQRWDKFTVLQQHAIELNDGWPWELYTPILQSIVEHNLELFSGNIGSAELRRWTATQGAYKPEQLIKEYAYSNENFKTLKKNIIDSHCGYGGEEFVRSMARAQMQRDNVMAASLVGKDLVEKDLPVVFIVGSGHVRNDYAVPMQLRKKYKQTSYLSVAYLAVQEDKENLQDYLQQVPELDELGPDELRPDKLELYDILYFTPSHTNEDLCVKFRKQLKNMQHRQAP